MSTVLIYTSGDQQHGMGHVVRSAVLADALAARGIEVEFLVTGTAGYVRMRHSPHYVYPLDVSNERMLSAWEYHSHDALIIDIEGGPSRELLEAVRPHYPLVLTLGAAWSFPFKDKGDIARLVDLQVYQSVLQDPPNGGHVLAGIEWLIIRPDYAACTPNYQDGHIVVSLGGADPHSLTEIAIEALHRVGRKRVVVTGPAREPIEGDGIFHAPDSLAPFLDGAALCVCALGMTTYEALAAGVPCLLTNWSADHERTAQELENRGVAWNMGLWPAFTAGGCREMAQRLVSNPGLLRLMGQRGRALVDAKGADRAAEAIWQFIAEKSLPRVTA